MRVVLGLLKGGIIGAGLGFGFHSLNLGGVLNWVLYGLIGALVGFVAGRPFWKHDTIWTPVVKAVVGVAICIGLYAVVAKLFGDPSLSAVGLDGQATSFPYVLGGVIGVLYGIFVEVDDGGKDGKKGKKEGG